MIIKTAKVTGKEKIEVVEMELPILKDNNILIKVLPVEYVPLRWQFLKVKQ